MNIISLGAGVQSSTMALMAAHGEITPMPDAAIFADTQWEPAAVYEWLSWLEKQLPFPTYRVTAGNLREATLSRSKPASGRIAAIPWHMKLPNGDAAIGRRQCTNEYKLEPIKKQIVKLTGGRKRGSCTMWIGISADEVGRVRPSRVKYIINRHPLIENIVSRNDCLRWMQRHEYPQPPRSSCIACPYHNDSEWRAIKANPLAWADAIEVDEAIRHQPRFRGSQFVHRSLLPLDQVDFSTDEDRGQLNMFNNECEGMCGV